ncbi:MAG: hypothetical protein ACRDDF_06660, partial [Aeromonas sp.]
MASTVKCPYTFSGGKEEDAQLFAGEITEFLLLNNVSQEYAKLTLSLALQKEAKQWYRTIPKECDFTFILESLVHRFTPADKLAVALNALSDTSYDHQSSLQSYLDSMKLIAMKGNITNEILLAMIYKNVPSVVQAKLSIIRQEQGLTWDQVYYMAKVYDERPKNTNSDLETFYTTTRPNQSSQYKTPRQKKRYCKFHKTTGHWTSECRSKNRLNELNTKEEDLKEEENENNRSINKSYYNYTTYFQKSTLPTLNIELNGIKLIALLDTG